MNCKIETFNDANIYSSAETRRDVRRFDRLESMLCEDDE